MTRYARLTFEKLLKQRDPVLWKRIDVMKYDAEHNWLRPLGKNGFEHSERVEEYLNRLVPDDIKEGFDPGEIFVLLCSVYLHDIGLRRGRKDHERIGHEEILKNFREYGLSDKFQGEAVATVCYGHASEKEYPISNIPRRSGVASLSGEPLDLQFLAALLRLADEIDNAYTRVIGFPDEKESMRHLVKFVDIDIEHWSICFQTKPENIDEWKKLVGMRNYTQERLNEITWVLERRNLLYNRIELEPKCVLDIKIRVGGEVTTGSISADECFAERCILSVEVYTSEGQIVTGDLREIDWSCQYYGEGLVLDELSRAYKDKAARTPSEETGQSAVCCFTRTTAGTWGVQAELARIHEIAPGKTTMRVDRGEIDNFDIRLGPRSRGRIRDGVLIAPKGGKVVFEGVAWDKHGNIGPIPEEVANDIRIEFMGGSKSS